MGSASSKKRSKKPQQTLSTQNRTNGTRAESVSSSVSRRSLAPIQAPPEKNIARPIRSQRSSHHDSETSSTRAPSEQNLRRPIRGGQSSHHHSKTSSSRTPSPQIPKRPSTITSELRSARKSKAIPNGTETRTTSSHHDDDSDHHDKTESIRIISPQRRSNSSSSSSTDTASSQPINPPRTYNNADSSQRINSAQAYTNRASPQPINPPRTHTNTSSKHRPIIDEKPSITGRCSYCPHCNRLPRIAVKKAPSPPPAWITEAPRTDQRHIVMDKYDEEAVHDKIIAENGRLPGSYDYSPNLTIEEKKDHNQTSSRYPTLPVLTKHGSPTTPSRTPFPNYDSLQRREKRLNKPYTPTLFTD